MATANSKRTGRLFDLGPDGLGFIVPGDDPDSVVAFVTRRCRLWNFREAGPREGDCVEFHVNDQHQVDEIRLVP